MFVKKKVEKMPKIFPERAIVLHKRLSASIEKSSARFSDGKKR
jgi:hypothetical protein